MKRGILALVLLAAALSIGCQGLVNLPPGTLHTPKPGTPPTPTPTPTPEPPGPLPGGAVIPDAGAVAVSPRPPADPALVAAVNAAALKVAGCPEGPPSRCVVLRPLDLVLREIAAELRAQGITAGIQAGADEVCAGTSSRCTGFHVFACAATCERGTIAWAPGSVRDTWTTTVAPGPEPTPTPTVPPTSSGCPAGTPPPGKYIVTCHVKPANPAMVFCDSTPKVVGEREYCAPDLNCPYRGGEGSAERIACERALALPVWTGADVRDDNQFSADAARGAVVKVCARDFPGACGETVAP